jgi:hypothetical protein
MSTSTAAIKLKSAFRAVTADIDRGLLSAPHVPAKSWQSTTAPQPMPELLNYSFSLDLLGVETPKDLAFAIKPNLPWADQHFVLERISGHPVNPGETYKIWADGKSAANHLREGRQFDHSYAERYWPKYAGQTPNGRLDPVNPLTQPMTGYRFPVGDLDDLITVLKKDPLTRQAYLPIWFPEDLGAIVHNNARVPCTLGYHFIRREDQFHCVYPMRSCDYMRHFRDDVYLTARLQAHVLETLRSVDADEWGQVRTGTLTMHMTSLHCFASDLYSLTARARND